MSVAIHSVPREPVRDSWFASLMVDLSTRFMRLAPEHIDSAIEDAQKLLCEHLGLDRSTLWQRSPESGGGGWEFQLTHLHQLSGHATLQTAPERSHLSNPGWLRQTAQPPSVYKCMNAASFFPWIFEQVRRGEKVVLDSLEDLPPEAALDREVLERYGTRATVVVPLSSGDDWLGCISFASMRSERRWSADVVRRLELAAHLFAHALARKNSVQSLRENELRLSAIFNTAAEGIITTNDQGIIDSLNAAASRISGYTAEELVGKAFSMLLAPLQRREHEEYLARHHHTFLSTTLLGAHQALGQRKNGSIYPLELTVSRVTLHNRALYTGFLRDVTGVREAARALRESEQRFRNIADSAPILIWMYNPAKAWFFFNRPWLAFTGRSLAQELGEGWTAGIHSEDRGEFLHQFNDAAGAQEPIALHFRLRRHDGVYRWLVTSAVPQFDVSSRFSGFIGSCTDITDQKEAERSARELSGLLIKSQEEQRARLARELHDDVSQRLARFAIDMGRIAQDHPEHDTQGNLIRGVREGLVQLSRDVHSLSYELHPSALIDLGLVDALRAECAEFSRRESVSAELKLRALPRAIPRETALGLFRIAQEALRNAIRHGRAARIEITLWGIDGGLQIIVHDDGLGFDPSRRARTPSLGLASMRERARLLCGDFDVESEPGLGTTIIAWVPLPEASK